jgi:hypothetical protein
MFRCVCLEGSVIESHVVFQARFSKELLDRVEAFCDSQMVRPSRAEAIRFLVERALDSFDRTQPRRPRARVE